MKYDLKKYKYNLISDLDYYFYQKIIHVFYVFLGTIIFQFLFIKDNLIASSKTFLSPTCVRAEHSKYVQFNFYTSNLALNL